MAETLARIGGHGNVELIDDETSKVSGSFAPFDAAYLARAILACAAILSGQNPPKAGVVIGDAQLPVIKWIVGISNLSGEPLLALSIPSGIEMSFQLTRQGARDLGAALIEQADRPKSLEHGRGTVH
jgi:hypothetical protein